MRALVAIFVAVLAGCDPVFYVEVHVADRAGAPLERAHLSLVDCVAQDDQNEHSFGLISALTDVDGYAWVGGAGRYPPACDIVVARPGFATFATSLDDLCGGHRPSCDPSQSLDVVLDAE